MILYKHQVTYTIHILITILSFGIFGTHTTLNMYIFCKHFITYRCAKNQNTICILKYNVQSFSFHFEEVKKHNGSILMNT